MGLQQMATPRAGDNRVAAQMDGRHVHNAVAALQRWMGAGKDLAEKPATWTFRLRVDKVPRITSISQTWIKIASRWLEGWHQYNSRNKIIVTFSFGNGK